MITVYSNQVSQYIQVDTGKFACNTSTISKIVANYLTAFSVNQ